MNRTFSTNNKDKVSRNTITTSKRTISRSSAKKQPEITYVRTHELNKNVKLIHRIVSFEFLIRLKKKIKATRTTKMTETLKKP